MINNIINWTIENYEWVFSGIGASVFLGVIAFFRKSLRKKSEEEKGLKIDQKNEGRNNTQIGIQNNNYYGGSKNVR